MAGHWHIIGHERAVRVLAHAATRESPAHSYLLIGSPNVGKRTLAREFAAALNCTALPSDRPCHACHSCRVTTNEVHPDVIYVERSGDERVKIDRVREARDSMDWRPYQGRFKVYILVDADNWGQIEASGSALLTALEEPPPQVVLLVTAAQANAVPATIVSRCRMLPPLQPVPLGTLATGLETAHGAAAADATRLAALSRGRAGWAIDALRQPEVVAAREAAVARAVALSEGPMSRRLRLAGEACKGENFLESRALCLATLDDMRVWWRDLLLVASGATTAPVHADRHDELARQVAKRGAARIVRGLQDIEATAGSVERNVTPRLALEALLLRLY